MRVLGIESSCDDTAAAVYDSSAGLLSNVVSSQVPVHSLYGGIVPELASREHIRSVVPVVERALAEAGSGREKIDGIAVTAGPGLIGYLLVGLCFAKSLAYAWGKPLYGADHLEAHIFSIFLEQEVPFPFVALLVSGGHTSLFRVSGWEEVILLGGTLDDAAGEARGNFTRRAGRGGVRQLPSAQACRGGGEHCRDRDTPPLEGAVHGQRGDGGASGGAPPVGRPGLRARPARVCRLPIPPLTIPAASWRNWAFPPAGGAARLSSTTRTSPARSWPRPGRWVLRFSRSGLGSAP